jgi:hypothetical protein
MFDWWEVILKRLGGTCGIPAYDDRTYLCVTSVTEIDGHVRPLSIHWANGRDYPVVACCLERTFGRWDTGNFVICWDVELLSHSHRTLWWEGSRWFVQRRHETRNGEPDHVMSFAGESKMPFV